MNIVNKKVDELIPYEKNPRKNDEAVKYVEKSIKEFGFKVPIVIDKNNVVVTGHTRLKASKKLGLKEVPCIIADDLTDEQIKAFRLADNKVSEFAQWDFDLLNDELKGINELDMKDFDFNILDKDETEDLIEKENERVRTIDNYNLDLYDPYMSSNKWQMPIILNDDYIPNDLIGFNYAKSSENKNTCIHFYIDDYQFERIWNNPEEYVKILAEYNCILSPDFSLYIDMPLPMKMWNVFRSRLIGNYYQSLGIRVIPTLSWAEKETFDFCFEGVPEGSIVSISTIGVKRNETSMQIWKDGMDELIKRIKPTTIICYGGKVDYDYKGINVIYFENKVTEKMKEMKNND